MKHILCKLFTLLAGIGAFNWLLVALLDFNLVSDILGEGSLLATVLYVLIGVSGLKLILSMFMKIPVLDE